MNVCATHSQPTCGCVSEIVKAKVGDVESRQVRLNATLTAAVVTLAKTLSVALVFLIERQRRERRLSKLVEVDDSPFSLLSLRQHNPVVH